MKINDIVIITCYGQTETMHRQDAIAEYQEAMMCCEGSEAERYSNIYFQLLEGRKHCSDTPDMTAI